MNSEDNESIPPADPNIDGGDAAEEGQRPRREDSWPLSMSSEEQDSIAFADLNLDGGVAVVEEDEPPRREDSLPLSMSSEEQDSIAVADPNLDGGVAAEEDGEPSRREDFGKMLYGCEHYQRRCKLRTPCCDQIFACRHCHNEAAGALSDPKKIHELVRQDVKQVICAVCDTEQEVSELCSNCGVKFGEYFCGICKFYDDDISKEQFHCDDCGICRVGGRENFFHCIKCGSCYSVELQNNHSCVENSMKNYCPICYEFMFDSVKGAHIMKCGHTMHMDCFKEMMKKTQYRCPICSKSAIDMTSSWESIDQEISATPMPEDYRYEVTILCNDCNSTSEVPFHIFGHKCRQCNSYNTRRSSKGGG